MGHQYHRERVDGNQREVVTELRKRGYTVQSLSSVGGGCPDLVVGFNSRNWLFELKDIAKPPSAQKLTKAEVAWHKDWLGQVDVVMTADEIEEVIRGASN